MRQRGVVRDNGWSGWSRQIMSAFQHGDIYDIGKNNIELEKWFDPTFQEFKKDEIIPTVRMKIISNFFVSGISIEVKSAGFEL